jgi:hypothetical protein
MVQAKSFALIKGSFKEYDFELEEIACPSIDDGDQSTKQHFKEL